MSFNKETNKNYLFDKDGKYGQKASGELTFKESIPNYAHRLNCEAIFTAKGTSTALGKEDTNAQIVIGRDRWPEDPINSESSTMNTGISPASGYSSYHGAGAIDIVVGRNAPYPVRPQEGVSHHTPLYNTVVSRKILGEKPILNSGDPNGTPHDGTIMDAARIYISQMCKPDEYFKLNKAERIYANNGASSGIVLKADKIRVHARRDVYVHAGGDFATSIDSCGYSLTDAPKIHLMVGNGELPDDSYVENGEKVRVTRTTRNEKPTSVTPEGKEKYEYTSEKVSTGFAPQHPVPRGDNLVECLSIMLETIKDGFSMINDVLIEQNQFNAVIANHVHGTAVGLTTQCPLTQTKNAITTMAHVKGMISAFQATFNNLPAVRANYLKRSGYKYINSRNVTVT